MRYWSKIIALFKNTEVTLRTLIWAILTLLAIWDVERIIRAYISENPLTLVSLAPVSDTYPFLENAVIVFYRNDEPSIFRETRGMSELELDSLFDLSRSKWYREASPKAPGSRDRTTSVNFTERVHYSILSEIALFSDLIWQNSTGLWPALADRTHLARALRHLDHQIFERTLVNFLSDPAVLKMVDLIWVNMEESVVHAWSHRSVPLFNLFTAQVVFNIDLEETIMPSGKDQRTDQNATFFSDQLDPGAAYNTTLSLRIDFSSLTHEVLNKPDRTTSTRVTITNSGMYDRSRFSDCTSQYTSEEECERELTAQTKVDVCNLHSFRRKALFHHKKILESETILHPGSLQELFEGGRPPV